MSSHPVTGLSIIVPAFNEAHAIGQTLNSVKAVQARLGCTSEVIVVDDGSTDGTAVAAARDSVRVIRHPVNGGYGRSLLTGIDAALYDTVAILDADGTYPVDRLPDLLAFYNQGFDMAVGARQGSNYYSSLTRRFLRFMFRCLGEFTCGRKIPDINSGFRIFDRRPVLARKRSLSAGFSFTTTITLLFMLDHLFVGYMPIAYNKRIGATKVKLVSDSLRSLQIIVTTIAQFNPIKLFLLLGMALAAGNGLLLVAELDAASAAIWSVAWNALCLLLGTMILGLILIKPSER